MKRYRALALATAMAAPLILTGCEKPAPAITVFAGTSSVTTEARCWAEGEAITPESCPEISLGEAVTGDAEADSLTIRPGAVVGVSVDPTIAEQGWTITLNGSPILEETVTETYYRFTWPTLNFQNAQLTLRVVSGQVSQPQGLWRVDLNAEIDG